MISIVQNFICTKEKRLKVIQHNTPKISEVFKDNPFYINYNSTINSDEVYSLYKNNIKNLNFYNNLEKNWGSITLALVNEVKTPYIITHCEDLEYHITSNEWSQMMEEIIKKDISYLPIGRLWKYTRDEYKSNYIEGDNLFLYKPSKSPGSSFSVDGIYKTNLFKELLENYLKYYPNNESNRFPIHLPHHFEHHYTEPNGPRKLEDNITYAIPKTQILTHNCEDTETYLNK